MGHEKPRGDDEIAVDEDDRVAPGGGNAEVAGGGGAFVVLGEELDVGKSIAIVLQPLDGAVGGAIVYHKDFIGTGVGLGFEGSEALFEDGLAVVGGDDDAEVHR